MIMCVLLCYPVSIHMSQLQATGRPISSSLLKYSQVVLVSNNNIFIDIKPYFCLLYRSILKYRVMDVFPRETFQTRKF